MLHEMSIMIKSHDSTRPQCRQLAQPRLSWPNVSAGHVKLCMSTGRYCSHPAVARRGVSRSRHKVRGGRSHGTYSLCAVHEQPGV